MGMRADIQKASVNFREEFSILQNRVHPEEDGDLAQAKRRISRKDSTISGSRANAAQRSMWSSIQISLRDSLIGSSRCVDVTAMSIWTVRGVNWNCADRNEVTGNGSPMGLPVEISKRRPHTLGTPVRFDTKKRMRPSGPHRGLSSNQTPSVIGRHAPPAVEITYTVDVDSYDKSCARKLIQR
jgi:hypothetical protein